MNNLYCKKIIDFAKSLFSHSEEQCLVDEQIPFGSSISERTILGKGEYLVVNFFTIAQLNLWDKQCLPRDQVVLWFSPHLLDFSFQRHSECPILVLDVRTIELVVVKDVTYETIQSSSLFEIDDWPCPA